MNRLFRKYLTIKGGKRNAKVRYVVIVLKYVISVIVMVVDYSDPMITGKLMEKNKRGN